jgi:hypothetical protein
VVRCRETRWQRDLPRLAPWASCGQWRLGLIGGVLGIAPRASSALAEFGSLTMTSATHALHLLVVVHPVAVQLRQLVFGAGEG